MITEVPCLASFAGDRAKIVIADASRIRLGKTSRQRPNDNTIGLRVFASRYLKYAQTIYSIGELELLAAVWGLEKFIFNCTAK